MTEGSLSVLVVTDHRPLSSQIAYAFPEGVAVSFATDANEARRMMRETTPSVVVMDIRTGNAGGYGLSRDMVADARLSDVPRLVLLERHQDSWLAKQAGATRYRVMPISDEELVEEALALASEMPAAS